MRCCKLSFWKTALASGVLVVGTGLAILGTLSGPTVPAPAERAAYLSELPERAAPLISAIRRFNEDNGTPPRDLVDLTPRYLSVIPSTGIVRFSEYTYKVLNKDEQAPAIWYDLGTPPPSSQPVQRFYSYFGPAESAILLLTFHGDDRIRLCMIDGLAFNPVQKEFNARDWRSNRVSRVGLAKSLVAQSHDIIRDKADALRLLGKPDGGGLVRDTPWELSVHCRWDKWNQDRIIYWPTRKYWTSPGHVFPVGDWLYICAD